MNRKPAVITSLKTMVVLGAVMLTAAMEPSFAQGTSAAAPKVLADGAGAKSGRFDNMNRTRFIEIFLAHRDANTGKLVAETYNTMFTTKGIPASKDTAPQALVEGLDFAKIKTDLAVNGRIVERTETLVARLDRD